eukprot:2709021-Amphidinium_carterae.1
MVPPPGAATLTFAGCPASTRAAVSTTAALVTWAQFWLNQCNSNARSPFTEVKTSIWYAMKQQESNATIWGGI